MLDTLIRGAKIVDGTGKAAFTADVGILDGMIEEVGNLSNAQAFETIEAAGRVLTPGFIDMHRHADAALFREGFGEAELCQGLTTLVNGNCGMSLAPLSGAHADECAKYLAPITGNIPPELRFASIDSYFKAAQGRGLPLSCAELIGMGTLRTLAAGFTTGDLSPLELRDLHYHMEAALADGACGVSLGLGYAPEIFYSTDGLIRALAPLHRSGVPICVHMRQEGDGVVDALREMLEVARALQTPLEVSHLKAIGGRNARKAVPEMLSLIEKARQDGLDVMCDVYPYTAGSTQLIHVLPPEFQEGGTEALTKRLLDDAARKEMRARMEAGSDFENITLLVGFDNVIAIGLQMDEYRRFEGKSVAEIAQTLQKDPFDTLFDLLAAEQCNTGMIDYISDEEDVKDILRAPFSGVISDATYPSGGRVHPRVYGTFARLIEKYVVQERVLTLEQAVHKVTGHAADRFGFEKKGVIAAGMDADLLLFSPENVREHGTYARPNLPATGFDEVFVLGERFGFSLFGARHLVTLALYIGFAALSCKLYKAADEKKRAQLRGLFAVLLLADEAFKQIGLQIGGNFNWDYLPLHLCSINIFLIALYAWKPSRLLDNFLYFICIPAATAALLFPTWTSLPAANFMFWHSTSVHILLAAYPIMLFSGGDIRPSVRYMGKCFLLLLAMAVPIYCVNLLLDTNFMFLMYAPDGNPLAWFRDHVGYHWIGFPVLLVAVFALMDVPILLKSGKRINCSAR